MRVETQAENEQPSEKKQQPAKIGLRVAAVAILALVAAYAIAVIAGLPQGRRIDPAALGIIGIGALAATILFRPDVFERVTKLEVAGWKVEIERRQEKQDEQLRDIQLILPILLPKEEQSHLLNLADGKTANYKANHDVRSQLRRLRFLKLLRMLPNKEIGQMKDETIVDIGQFVALTDLGQRWVNRIKEIEAEAAKSTPTNKASD